MMININQDHTAKCHSNKKAKFMIASALMFPSASFAQSTGLPAGSDSLRSSQLEDIIVTARRREESSMTVPVAVTAISSETLERAGASNLEQIAELAPQVQIMRASSGNGGIISIRGLGTPALDAGLEQSVSVNIDGVQAGRGNIVSQGFFDLGQVEVLKGPQVLFFGKNSPAGVISLRSANPTDKLEGYVRAGYEFEAHKRYGEAAVGGPLTDTLKARIAVRGSDQRGWMKNTAIDRPTNPFYPQFGTLRGPKSNGGKELIGRITVLYTPSSDFDATLKVSGGTFKDNGPTNQTVCGPNLQFPVTTGITDTTGDCVQDDRFANVGLAPSLAATLPGARDGRPYTDTWATLTSFTMNWHLPNVTVTSVTGFMKLKLSQGSSFAYTSFGTTYGIILENSQTFSQEFRAVSDYDGPLNFTMGALYERAKRSSGVNIIGLGTTFGIDPATGRWETWDVDANNKGDTLSAFGELRWSIFDRLELAGGVRYTKEEKDTVGVNTYVAPAQGPIFALAPQGFALANKFRDSNWSPQLTLSWKPVEGTLVYAAYKTGYKSGGISNPSRLSAVVAASPAGQSTLNYESEKAKGGEIGVKSYLFDRTVRVEATAYSYLFSNLQVSAFDSVAQMSFLTNAGTARIKGLELSSEWAVTQGLRLNGSATYNSARYKSFPNALCYLGQTPALGCNFAPGSILGRVQDLSGAPLTRAPRWTFGSGFNYDVPITSDIVLGLTGSANYTSSYHTAEDHNPFVIQKGFTLFNATARIYQEKEGWELSLIGRNLADKYYKKLCNARNVAAQFSCGYVRGRELTLQAAYRF